MLALDPDQPGLEGMRRAPVPGWTSPMLATLTRDTFSDEGWIYERKLDGERCLAFRDGDAVRLCSRNRQSLNETYPELVDALEAQPCRRFVVDGEVVAFDGALTSFSRLQGRLGIHHADEARASGIAVYYYLFDILHLDGWDLTRVPLRRRKALLKQALRFDDPLRFTPHRNEMGERLLQSACAKGWEGIIAKRADAPYVHKRSRDWLKFKCSNGQELVIGGFTDPAGSRVGFGALLLGYYENDALIYAGKVGTGFDTAELERLRGMLDEIERGTPPFAGGDAPSEDGVHWVEPKLVAEVGFTEWTDDGRLRHPRYLGLRDDKPARAVVRERPD
ncbi:MAG: non-homologous end-joining DNA ligase [Pseudomonadales bacterium]|jgi:bifunctional non-homologous end joining protein LigD